MATTTVDTNDRDHNGQYSNQKTDTSPKNEGHTKKTEFQAKRAERHAAQAIHQAKLVEWRAGKERLTLEAHVHKSTVEAELAKAYGKKAETESEARVKCREAEDVAAHKKGLAITKKNEALARAQPYKDIAKAIRTEAKLATSENKKTRGKAKIEAREAEAKAYAIEAEANEAEAEARKAAVDVKKATLELEEIVIAITLRTKHAEAAAKAESQAKVKKAEIEDRRAEAAARRAQAAAKIAEAKAIRAGDIATAEAYNLEARVQKAKAITQCAETREKQAKIRALRKKTSHELQPVTNQSPKRQARFAEKKHLSAAGLISTVREVFQEIPNQKQGIHKGESTIPLDDCLMSGLAIYSLKYPSLLQFCSDSQEGGCIHHNLQTLYKVNQVPSDTYMRERLDVVDPVYLRPAFKQLFAQLQRGKELEAYTFLDGHYLALGDGTGCFSSKTIHCDNCCTKHHRDGTISYYHQMMCAAIAHPDHATVIPFCPEAIINTDGSTKNDCERNAAERLYRHIRREHPHLPLIITEDALGSNGPHIRLLKELDMRFILVVKPDGNKTLFEYLKGGKREEYLHTDQEFSYKIQYINNIPLNDSHSDLNVNYLEAWIYDKNGELQYHNSWVTDVLITMRNVYRLYQGGRAKWKIENETFNTLKNQGYHFEHNYGHGNKNLSTIFPLLMFLAFLIDQIQQSCCGLFQGALMTMKSKVRLWVRMRAYFTTLFIESWEKFWQGIAFGIQGGHLIPLLHPIDTS